MLCLFENGSTQRLADGAVHDESVAGDGGNAHLNLISTDSFSLTGRFFAVEVIDCGENLEVP